ncbi:MAG: sugar transferase [Chloroflexi bacterium]|nr:sugar transferase [Chloroflexota bacterium]
MDEMTQTNYGRKSHSWRLRLGERQALLFFGDLLTASIAILIALYIWGSADKFPGFSLEFIQRRVPPWFFLFPMIWLVLLVEIYDVHQAGSWKATVRSIATAGLLGFGLYLLLYFYYVDPPKSLLPRRGVAGFFIAAPLLTLAWRLAYIRVFTDPKFMRRVLLIGAGRAGQALVQLLNGLWPPPFYLVGIVDDDVSKVGAVIEGQPVVGSNEALAALISEHNVSDLLVAITGELKPGMFQALLEAQERGVTITRLPKAYEEMVGRVPIRLLEADWILRSFVDEIRTSGFYELAKRLMDLGVGLIGSLALLALLPFIALAIVLDDGFPVFYTQVRSGRGAIPYQILKLRTMRRDAEADGKPQWAKEADERATRVGRILRKTHLDELPQFLNVLRGEMSMVGPRAERPELMELFQKHVPFYRARLLVKPGITGWAQVNYGYATNIEETTIKLEYDLYYIKHRNLALDFLILLRTPATVVGFRGR